MARYPIVYIEACENYQKQSWRNRCRILSESGPLDLSFPIIHSPSQLACPSSQPAQLTSPSSCPVSASPLVCPVSQAPASQPSHPSSQATPAQTVVPGASQPALRQITEIKIEYTTPWIAKIKKALQSAYDSSPFFEYYSPELFAILDSHPSTLWELNTQITNYLCKKFLIDSTIIPTTDYNPNVEQDYRDIIHPKRPNTILKQLGLQRSYWQVFSQKFGFVSGLSALDLLFCMGPESALYLHI